MPFIALRDGEPVAPEEVEDASGTTLICPHCRTEMYVRSSYTRGQGTFVAKHFYHASNGGDGNECAGEGGESAEHRRMKSIALSKLKDRFPEHAEAGVEVEIHDRRADAAVRFPHSDPHRVFGEGIVAEVQYRHEEKDIDAATDDFLDAGYTVYWLEPEHFHGKNVAFSQPHTPTVYDDFSSIPAPNAHVRPDVPHQHSPPQVEVLLPPEWFEQHRDELREGWQSGHSLYQEIQKRSFVRPDDDAQETFDSY
ncbi:uncharacterized protein HHUB_4118 (plasmid) [Halobacterium hubeiense]|uniref:Competence protein CoiA-like family protein n=3 Tax=Halobacterium hubeiense TaxID=1407499 RepID=A0A0U5H4A2_9EURY|nr:hypothetical protein [Halobacterium hubeiense]CQH63555.1 uncharacterized protein HHUB_4118 [Halobacterium hubeiense]